MKCEECRQVLEEYVDGELNAARRANISAHIATCADCAKLEGELRQFAEVYMRYERDVEVTPALWDGVAARIKLEKPPRPASSWLDVWRVRLLPHFTVPRFSPALAAALVLVAIGVTVAVMSVLHSREVAQNTGQQVATNPNQSDNGNANRPQNSNQPATPSQPGNDATQATANGNTSNSDAVNSAPEPQPRKSVAPKQVVARAERKPVDPQQLVREAEQKYVTAIAILSRDVSRRRTQIDPVVLARFDNALADIDRTIQETKRVVREHPNDPVALKYLLSAYATKVDTLREMSLD
jgi:hypothetical protein